jgi:hypothetical protein
VRMVDTATPSPVPRPGRWGTSPFSDVRPDVLLAAGAVLAALLVGGVLGLARVPVVHLLTLGVITPLIVAFSQHQAETVLRTRPRDRTVLRVLLAGGVVAVVVGIGTGTTWVTAVGATSSSIAVGSSWWRLRGARRRALGPRFGWLVRAYERAHGAFLHGALLGALLGIGLIPGWAYLGTRLAHLHAMLLGFAAVTLLATLALYGPTLLRAQLEPGADADAARWVRRTATAATVAVLALLLVSAPGAWALAARLAAAAALTVAAIGAGVVALPLVRTAARKGRAAPTGGVLLTAASLWLAAAIAADAIIVGLGAWRWYDALGVALLVGALGQAIAATLLHVVTSWLPRERRLATVRRLDAAPRWLLVLPQVAVVVAVVAAAP